MRRKKIFIATFRIGGTEALRSQFTESLRCAATFIVTPTHTIQAVLAAYIISQLLYVSTTFTGNSPWLFLNIKKSQLQLIFYK